MNKNLLIAALTITLVACGGDGSNGQSSPYTPAEDSGSLTGTWLLLMTNGRYALTFTEEDGSTHSETESYSQRSVVNINDNEDGTGYIDRCGWGNEIIISGNILVLPDGSELSIISNSQFKGHVDESYSSPDAESENFDLTAIKINNALNAAGDLTGLTLTEDGQPLSTDGNLPINCINELEYQSTNVSTAPDGVVTHRGSNEGRRFNFIASDDSSLVDYVQLHSLEDGYITQVRIDLDGEKYRLHSRSDDTQSITSDTTGFNGSFLVKDSGRSVGGIIAVSL